MFDRARSPVMVELAAFAATVLMAASAPVTAAEPIPGASPVPPSWIQGRTLRVPDLNFAVDAPGDAWQWLQVALPNVPAGTATFACVDPASDSRLMVNVFPKDTRGSAPGKFLDGFLAGFKERAVAQGWTLTRESVQPSDVPLPGSTRFVIEGTRPDGSRLAGQGYLLQSNRVYGLQKFTVAEAGFQDLEAMARTFRLLEAPREYKPANLNIVYFTILAVVWGAAALLNLIIRRAVVNGALVAGALILIAAGALIVRTAGSLSAETLGYRMGEALIPLVIAAWGAQRFYKKHGWAESRPAPR